MSSRPAVVLIGPPAAGKSRIGKKVAKYLSCEFVDTDSMIVAECGPVAEIFSSRGEPAFRELEHDAVARALSTDGVVSLGGGAVMHPETRRLLGTHRVVMLTVSAEAVAQRIQGQRRPLLAAETPEDRLAAWQSLVDARSTVYESLASRTWDTSVRPITAIAAEIAEWARSEQTSEHGAGEEPPREATNT